MALFDDTCAHETRRAGGATRDAAGARVRRKARRRAFFLAVGFAAWWFSAWAAASFLAAGAGASVSHADALVVLAGSSAYVERTRLAAESFVRGRAPVVLLTNDGQRGGWSREEERNPLFVERAESELKTRGVPQDGIEVVPGTVSGTFDEATRVRAYAEGRGFRSLLVVTSAYQVRRARWTFEKVFEGSGVEVSFEAVPPGDETPTPPVWWLHARGWQMVAGEYVKMIYYLARHS
ncbi:MAG TPA: YdcF family protein [Pyrinomonadaceae bacterium]|nr:YdcF family protein [Pyrinomonadaceae bacterium]